MLDFNSVDLTVPYLIVSWIGAFLATMEIQMIAHGQIMKSLNPIYRHMVRVALACVAVTLMWSGYAPIKYDEAPWPSDLALVGSMTGLLLIRTISGISWARKGGKNVHTQRQC